MKAIQRYAAVWMLALVVGCVGLQAPRSFEDRLAVGLGTVTVVASTTKTLLQAKKITPDDAENVLVAGTAALRGLEVARTLHRADSAAGESRLSAVMVGLRALQDYLKTKE